MGTFLTVFLGILLGLLIVSLLLGLLMLITPLIMPLLVNNPRDEPIRPNRVHFFTYMEPGQVKIIIQLGKNFVRAIMNDSERKFAQIGDPENADYWWVEPAQPGQGSKPIPPLNPNNPFSRWEHWVYKQTGAVFTGIWPFQVVRVEKNRRLIPKVEEGKAVIDNKGRAVLEEIEDWSDHLRVKNFLWYFDVPTVDTKDYLGIGFQGNILARCINPYLTTYNQDRWDMVLTNKVDTLVTAYGQIKEFAELSKATPETQSEMGNYLKEKLNETLSPQEVGVLEKRGTGIEIMQADITDRDPHLDATERLALTEPWKADQTKLATIKKSEGDKQRRINESEGEAQAIVNRIAAIKSDGEIGKMLVEYDAWKESAKAGGATFFFGDNRGGGKELNPIVFAKLEEIRKQLANKADKPEKTAEENKPSRGKKGGK